MNPLKSILLIVYILIVVIYTVVRLNVYDNNLILIIQPFMLLSLAGFYIVSAHKMNFLFLLALLSTMIGSFLFVYEYSVERFAVALSFIFMANMLFLILIVHRMKVINTKDILVIALPVYILLLLLVCTFFNVLSVIKFLIFIHSISLALLLSFAFLNYKKSSKTTALLMLIGIIFLVFRDFFNGLNKFLEQENKFYLLITLLSHALAMYFVCRSTILESSKEFLKERSN